MIRHCMLSDMLQEVNLDVPGSNGCAENQHTCTSLEFLPRIVVRGRRELPTQRISDLADTRDKEGGIGQALIARHTISEGSDKAE